MIILSLDLGCDFEKSVEQLDKIVEEYCGQKENVSSHLGKDNMRDTSKSKSGEQQDGGQYRDEA